MKLQLLSLLFVFLVGTVQAAESDDARITDLSPMLLLGGPQESYFVTMPTGRIIPHLELDASLSTNFQGPSMVIIDPVSGQFKRSILGYQHQTSLRLTGGLFNNIELQLHLPFIHSQRQKHIGFGLETPDNSAGFGDPEFIGSLKHFDQNSVGLDVTSTIFGRPALSSVPYSNSAYGTLGYRLTVAKDVNQFRGAILVGADLRSEQTAVQIRNGSELRVGGGFEYTKRTQYTDHRFSSEVLLNNPMTRLNTTSQLGGLLGIGYKFATNEHWQLGTGFQVGLTEAFGVPNYRAFLQLGYRHLTNRRPPRCVNSASYLVDERCPPPDTDNDGIPDPTDRCIDEPEDQDDFDDEDGCPDPDNDNDKLLDTDDSCPNEPEDYDEFEDQDGCPDSDNDGDGIPDSADQCPLEPEIANGFEDEDGCPEPDGDQDGIPDALDRCPAQPEDKDGFEDDDGCPDLDNDKDGILDKDDLCPNEPEDFNDVRDDDGCPDRILAVQTSDEIVITDEIRFVHGQVIPTKESKEILVAVKNILVQHTGLQVQIEGHTDDYGGGDFNRYLSQARAQAVLDSLVRLAGNSEALRRRLKAVGFGKDKPAAPNDTKQGRALNRRVLFKILKR